MLVTLTKVFVATRTRGLQGQLLHVLCFGLGSKVSTCNNCVQASGCSLWSKTPGKNAAIHACFSMAECHSYLSVLSN